MKATLQPHPMLLTFTNIDKAHTVTVDKATMPILEGQGAYSPIRGPRFCEYAMRDNPMSPPAMLGSAAIKNNSISTAIVSNRESSRCRRDKGVFETNSAK